MQSIFKPGKHGTPITLVFKSQLNEWLETQDETTQSWLKSQDLEGPLFSAIPGPEGKLARYIAILKEDSDFYIAGDLPEKLPGADYHLDTSGLFSDSPENLDLFLTQFAISWGLASYRFSKYKDHDNAPATLCLENETVVKNAEDYIHAINLTRDLINTPASDMMPENLAETMQEMASQFGGHLSQVIGDDLLDDNYPMIHAVGRASAHAPRLLDLRWGDENAPKVTLVGKGVCFDSGGLNLKTGNFMRLMKKDMGGAAHVLGLARLIMAQNLPIRLRVLVPAVENAVAGNAFRPGDVISTRKGLSVEIDNTDAEGRLVLCDALSEADTENPDVIIDFATLTGACRVALGTEVPGFFTQTEALANGLTKASERAKDPIWRLPLHAPYRDMLKSNIADTLNSSPTGLGGAITAALYLELFVSPETPWVHLDVMAWNDRVQPGRKIGGEAFGLRAVFDYLSNTYKD